MVTMTVTAESEEELNSKIEVVYRNYHPMGYGTMLKIKRERNDGTWVAIMTRYDSCD
jgi:hypothetical protein